MVLPLNKLLCNLHKPINNLCLAEGTDRKHNINICQSRIKFWPGHRDAKYVKMPCPQTQLNIETILFYSSLMN